MSPGLVMVEEPVSPEESLLEKVFSVLDVPGELEGGVLQKGMSKALLFRKILPFRRISLFFYPSDCVYSLLLVF